MEEYDENQEGRPLQVSKNGKNVLLLQDETLYAYNLETLDT